MPDLSDRADHDDSYYLLLMRLMRKRPVCIGAHDLRRCIYCGRRISKDRCPRHPIADRER